MALWTNNDGLRVRLGTTEAEITRGGEIENDEFLTWEFQLTLTDLGTASALVNDAENIIIPSGVRIVEVEVFTQTAATSGGSAALNVGLIRQDASTVYDADGLLAAVAITSHDADGEITRYRVGTSGVGALVGTTLANAGRLVADYDTAAYTAGELRIVIRGYVPRPSASN